MTPSVRKFALTAHVVSSVGWLGSVAGFLVLAVVGLSTGDDGLARAVYVVLEPFAWLVVVPLAFASLVSGVVQALGTRWGLLRHYWVIAKLVITVFAAALLLVHTGPIGRVADAAVARELGEGVAGVRLQLVVDAAAGLVVLVVATALSVYKPAGVTPLGVSRGAVGRVRQAG